MELPGGVVVAMVLPKALLSVEKIEFFEKINM